MQGEVGCSGRSGLRSQGLKLAFSLEPFHVRSMLVALERKSREGGGFDRALEGLSLNLSDRQALASLGASCIDHRASSAGFHADQKAVGTRPAYFGGLVGTFHFL